MWNITFKLKFYHACQQNESLCLPTTSCFSSPSAILSSRKAFKCWTERPRIIQAATKRENETYSKKQNKSQPTNSKKPHWKPFPKRTRPKHHIRLPNPLKSKKMV